MDDMNTTPLSPPTRGRPGSAASGGIAMAYSMDSDPTSSAAPASAPKMASSPRPQEPRRRQPPLQPQRSPPAPLPPAYAFQRSERAPTGGEGRAGSFATHSTEEDSLTYDRSLLSTELMEDSTSSGYEGLQIQQRQRQQQMGSVTFFQQMGSDGNANGVYQYQEEHTENNLATVSEYQAGAARGGYDDDGAVAGGDATAIIHQMHKKLLHLMSCPELFHQALEWQDRLDRGIAPAGTNNSNHAANDVSALTYTFETDEDSTFDGLKEDDQQQPGGNGATKTAHSQNESFEFDPNDSNNDNNNNNNNNNDNGGSAPQPREEIPLPHQIFAAAAEVVLPQALTASQLFGVERVTGVELEAAAGLAGLSQLFLRWLALMPDGDHANVIDPPGLTVMKISGGGYRVTGVHRVVWRWMNKFSPASTSPKDPAAGVTAMDFDCGDLVTLTVVDVFETDATGKLLSYCPTFDNRAVRRTPEVAERLRKGASQLYERMEVAARSPAGLGVNKAAGSLGKMSLRAAMVVGNAVKNKMQQQKQQYNGGNVCVPEEEQLNELMQSQIATDETEEDTNMDATVLEEDPTVSSPVRRVEV